MKKHHFTTLKGIFALSAAACLLSTSVSLTGCNGKQPKETVKLSIWGATADSELLETYVASFKEHYKDEATFEITICEEDEPTCKDTILMSPQAAGDVFSFADDQFDELYNGGALLPITENVDAIIAANGGAASAAIDAASADNTLYAYPATASNGYFLYYNADYYTDAQAASLDLLLEGAAKENKKFGMEFTSGWYLFGFFEAAGLDVHISDDGTHNICDWNSVSGKYTGADVCKSLIKLTSSKGFANLNNDALVEGLRSGEIISCISGTWNAPIIEECFGSGYRASMLPTFTVNGDSLQIHSVAGYKLVGVNAYTAEPYWAQKLAEWITNEDNQLLRFEMRGEGPSNINAANSSEVMSNPAIMALSKQSAYGHLQRVTGAYWSETYSFTNILMSGNLEGRDPQAILDELVKNISEN